jgi:hypothetical protein
VASTINDTEAGPGVQCVFRARRGQYWRADEPKTYATVLLPLGGGTDDVAQVSEPMQRAARFGQ